MYWGLSIISGDKFGMKLTSGRIWQFGRNVNLVGFWTCPEDCRAHFWVCLVGLWRCGLGVPLCLVPYVSFLIWFLCSG